MVILVTELPRRRFVHQVAVAALDLLERHSPLLHAFRHPFRPRVQRHPLDFHLLQATVYFLPILLLVKLPMLHPLHQTRQHNQLVRVQHHRAPAKGQFLKLLAVQHQQTVRQLHRVAKEHRHPHPHLSLHLRHFPLLLLPYRHLHPHPESRQLVTLQRHIATHKQLVVDIPPPLPPSPRPPAESPPSAT